MMNYRYLLGPTLGVLLSPTLAWGQATMGLPSGCVLDGTVLTCGGDSLTTDGIRVDAPITELIIQPSDAIIDPPQGNDVISLFNADGATLTFNLGDTLFETNGNRRTSFTEAADSEFIRVATTTGTAAFVLNSGTADGVGLTGNAIRVESVDGDVSFTGSGRITHEFSSEEEIIVTTVNGDLLFDFDGFIQTSGTDNRNRILLHTENGNAIVNFAGELSDANGDALCMTAFGGESLSFTNSGLIGCGFDSIPAVLLSRGDITFNNSGALEGSLRGSVSLFSESGSITATNSGIIRTNFGVSANADGDVSFVNSSGGLIVSGGFFTDGGPSSFTSRTGMVTVINDGRISGGAILNTSDGQVARFVNRGVLSPSSSIDRLTIRNIGSGDFIVENSGSFERFGQQVIPILSSNGNLTFINSAGRFSGAILTADGDVNFTNSADLADASVEIDMQPDHVATVENSGDIQGLTVEMITPENTSSLNVINSGTFRDTNTFVSLGSLTLTNNGSWLGEVNLTARDGSLMSVNNNGIITGTLNAMDGNLSQFDLANTNLMRDVQILSGGNLNILNSGTIDTETSDMTVISGGSNITFINSGNLLGTVAIGSTGGSHLELRNEGNFDGTILPTETNTQEIDFLNTGTYRAPANSGRMNLAGGTFTNNGLFESGFDPSRTNRADVFNLVGNFVNNGGEILLDYDADGPVETIDVQGTATINGGTLTFNALDGDSGILPSGVFLRASGGITGEFDTVRDTNPLIDVFVSTGTTEASAVLTDPKLAQDPDPDPDPVSPTDPNEPIEMVAEFFFSSDAPNAEALGMSYQGLQHLNGVAKAGLRPAGSPDGVRVWGQLSVLDADFDGSSTLASFDAYNGGATLGTDVSVGTSTSIGLALGYKSGGVITNSPGYKGDIQSTFLTAYSQQNIGKWQGMIGATYAKQIINGRRNVDSLLTQKKTKNDAYGLFAQASSPQWDLGDASLSNSTRLSYWSVSQEAFTEQIASSPILFYGSNTAKTAELRSEFTLATTSDWAGLTVTPALRAGAAYVVVLDGRKHDVGVGGSTEVNRTLGANNDSVVGILGADLGVSLGALTRLDLSATTYLGGQLEESEATFRIIRSF